MEVTKDGLVHKFVPTDLKMLAGLRIPSSGKLTDSLGEVAYMSEDSGRLYLSQFYNDNIEACGVCFLTSSPNRS